MSTPLVDLYRNHNKFSDGRNDYIGAPETKHAAELEALRDKASKFLNKYQHTNVDELAYQFHEATPDQWEEILHTQALDHIEGEIVRSIFPEWLKDLRTQIKEAKKSAEAYEEILAGLDTTATINTMTSACQALNGTHHDIHKAVQADPVAYKDFREAGRKLSQLTALLHFGGLRYNLSTNPELMVALYANPVNLPPLKATETGRAGVHEAHYTEEQLNSHNQIVEARSLVALPGRKDLFLAELAAGRWPTLTFHIAPTIKELKRRALVIADAGNIDTV